MQQRKIFFPNLDGLRMLAFLLVFLWHSLKAPFDILHSADDALKKAFYFFLNGKTGVSIFFVLSGFLITYLLLAEKELAGKIDVLKFYVRRSLRIWPLYFLILILVFVVMRLLMTKLGFNWNEFDMQPWMYFFFLSNFDVLHIYLIHGKDLLPSTVTWSVAIEEQFYLVWPLFFAILSSKMYRFLFPVVIAGSYFFRFVYADSEAFLNFHTISVCGDLAIGGWAAYLAFTNEKFTSFFASQSDRKRIFFYAAGIVVLYGCQFISNTQLHVFTRLVQAIYFAYIILDQNYSANTKWKFSSNRFFSFWGKYTYGLYLWHPVVLLVITLLLTKVFHLSLLNAGTHLLICLAGFIGSLLVSYLSYQYIEKFFLLWKTRFSIVKT